MNEPVTYQPRWMVWTDHAAHGFSGARQPQWFWAANGPRGSMNGCEHSADAAVQRGYAASHLLSDSEGKGA